MRPYTYDDVIYTSNGHPIPVRRNLMPRLPDWTVKNAIYLYESDTDAKGDSRLGASGFLLGVPFNEKIDGKTKSHVYAVTNAHVVRSYPVIRINDNNGGTDRIDMRNHMWGDWKIHPTNDIAIAYLGTEQKQWDTYLIMYGGIVTPEIAKNRNIGLGSDVFSASRLVGFEGKGINLPILRFGSIAQMERQFIRNDRLTTDPDKPFMQESILVECRSIPGHSGSAVIAVEGGLAERYADDSVEISDDFVLLGIVWSYLTDLNDLNTGIAGVVPAWKLKELIMDDDVKAFRDDNERRVIEKIRDQKQTRGGRAVPSDASKPKRTEEPTEDEFFSNLDKAIRPIEDDEAKDNPSG